MSTSYVVYNVIDNLTKARFAIAQIANVCLLHQLRDGYSDDIILGKPSDAVYFPNMVESFNPSCFPELEQTIKGMNPEGHCIDGTALSVIIVFLALGPELRREVSTILCEPVRRLMISVDRDGDSSAELEAFRLRECYSLD